MLEWSGTEDGDATIRSYITALSMITIIRVHIGSGETASGSSHGYQREIWQCSDYITAVLLIRLKLRASLS